MKANRAARVRTSDEDAVSNVIGGILFFSLVLIFLVVIRTTFVPVWEEDKEFRHMTTVQGQMADIKSEAERQAANQTRQSVTMPLTLLQPSASRFFVPANAPGELEFVPSTSSVTLRADEMLIFEKDGRTLGAFSEEWVAVGPGQEVDDVNSLLHLRLRLINPASAPDSAGVQITITDANGDFAGSLFAYKFRDPPDDFINTRITAPGGTVIYDQGVTLHQTLPVNFYWIDALKDELHFVDLLAAADGPFRLTLTEMGMQGEFTISYRGGSAGGTQGNAGRLIDDWNETRSGGFLRYQSRNQFFVQQTYIMQAGGVILEQPEGKAMRIDPLLSVSVAGGVTSIRATVPNLVGPPDGLTSTGTASVSLRATQTTAVLGSAPSWSMEVAGPYPDAWAAAWDRIMTRAGLSAAADEYEISTTANMAMLTINGRDVGGATHDLALELHHGLVEVRLQS